MAHPANDAKSQLSHGVRKSVNQLTVLLGALLVLALVVLLQSRGLGYLWSLVSILLALPFFWLLRAENQPKNLPVLIALIPAVKEWIAQDRQRHENLSLARRFKELLRLYGLWSLADGFEEELAKRIPYASGAVPFIVAELTRGLERPAVVTEDLLSLLYNEYTGVRTLALWESDKASLAQGLASILLDSNLLPKRRSTCKLGSDTVERLLQRMGDYRLCGIQDLFGSFDFVLQEAEGYIRFLIDHGVVPRDKPLQAAGILEIIETRKLGLHPHAEVAVVERTCRVVLEALGTEWLKESRPDDAESLIEALSYVSLALYTTERKTDKPDWTAIACRGAAARPESPKIVLAYLQLDKQRELEGAPSFLSIAYLARNWAGEFRRFKLEQPNGHELDLKHIKQKLTDGEWPVKLETHIAETFNNAGTASPCRVGLAQVLQQRPSIRQALNWVFRVLHPATVRRYLEARKVNPYILTFSSRSGHVRYLLACLNSPLTAARMKELGFELEVDGRPKYNFRQYTDSVRIGVVPKGWTFEEFHRAFQKDLASVVANRTELIPLLLQATNEAEQARANLLAAKELLDVELIVHQFGLTAGSYFGFVMRDITGERAIEELKKLFAGILEPDEILSLVEYQGDVSLPDEMLGAPLADLAADVLVQLPGHKSFLERRDSELRERLLQCVPGAKAENLGWHLAHLSPAERQKVVPKIASLLFKELTNAKLPCDPQLCPFIAQSYLETLELIASISPAAVQPTQEVV